MARAPQTQVRSLRPFLRKEKDTHFQTQPHHLLEASARGSEQFCGRIRGALKVRVLFLSWALLATLLGADGMEICRAELSLSKQKQHSGCSTSEFGSVQVSVEVTQLAARQVCLGAGGLATQNIPRPRTSLFCAPEHQLIKFLLERCGWGNRLNSIQISVEQVPRSHQTCSLTGLQQSNSCSPSVGYSGGPGRLVSSCFSGLKLYAHRFKGVFIGWFWIIWLDFLKAGSEKMLFGKKIN